MRFIRVAATAALLIWHAGGAVAAFNNGVESFAGTVKDLSTWGQFSAPPFQQNNALIYDNQNMFGTGSFNTIQQTVTWGKAVRMKAMTTEANAGVSLFLTNNSAGPNGFGGANSAFWSFDLNTNVDNNFNRIVMGTGSNGSWGDGNGIFTYEPTANHAYVLEIMPLALRSARFTLFDSDGTTVLESHLYNNSPIDVPNMTHISVVGIGGSAIINYVAVVPEPSTILFTMVAASALLIRRRKLPSPGSQLMIDGA